MKKNKYLVYLLVFLGLVFLLVAFRPWWSGFLEKAEPTIVNYREDSQEKLIDEDIWQHASSSDSIASSSRKLIIPSIEVDIPIIVSDNGESALGQGAWHIPGSGLPNDSEDYKNIVLSAHRFLYTSGPNTFYNLDKVEIGEELTINWEGKELKYKVAEKFVVEPSEVSILEDDGRYKLTLFTCTPVFTTDKRLVIVAYPIE